MKEKTYPPGRNAAPAPLPGPTPPPRRILVVEDDSNIRQLNSEVLTQCGYHVVAAGDGAAAWTTLQRNGYDLLITDNEMPRVTGVDLLKKLHAAHLAVPVIMATETPPMDEFSRCPWLTPAAMLTKP
jgi:CheY-like chemotaxis protein